MFKFRVMSAVLVVALTLTITGCSGKSGKDTNVQNTQEVAQKEDTTPIKVQYWHRHSDDQQKILNTVIEDFQKKYPYITVEPVYQGSFNDLTRKLLASVAANDVPAITTAETDTVGMYYSNGLLADLGPYIKRDKVNLDDFSKGMLDAYKVDNVQVALPLIVSCEVMVYNATMLKKLGVNPPQTWAEIEEFSKKVMVKEGDTVTRYPLAIPAWGNWYFEPFMINGGGSTFTPDQKASALDKPESSYFLKKFVEWKDKGYLFLPAGTGASETMRGMFFDEKIAMVAHTSASIKSYVESAKFEVGVVFPQGDKKRISQIGGSGMCTLAKAGNREKETAWKFINFITSSENNIRWAEGTGYLPTRKSAISSEAGKQYNQKYPLFKAVLDNFDNVVSRDKHAAAVESKKGLDNALAKVALENNKDVEALMKEAAKFMNDTLRDFK